MSPQQYQLCNHQVITQDISLITLSPLEQALDFKPGQYVIFHLPNGEKAPFSMANANPQQLEFLVRHGPHNPIADHFLRYLLDHKTMDLSGPYGHCVLPQEPQPLIFLSGGTGIASHKPLIEQALSLGFPSVSLYWGITSTQDLYLEGWLQSKQQLFPQFRCYPVHSLPDHSWTGLRGWVHEVMLEQEPHVSETLVYASGPFAMIQAIAKAYQALNLPADKLLSDML